MNKNLNFYAVRDLIQIEDWKYDKHDLLTITYGIDKENEVRTLHIGDVATLNDFLISGGMAQEIKHGRIIHDDYKRFISEFFLEDCTDKDIQHLVAAHIHSILRRKVLQDEFWGRNAHLLTLKSFIKS